MHVPSVVVRNEPLPLDHQGQSELILLSSLGRLWKYCRMPSFGFDSTTTISSSPMLPERCASSLSRLSKGIPSPYNSRPTILTAGGSLSATANRFSDAFPRLCRTLLHKERGV